MHIGAIADDFTGATDLATALRERGLRTAVVIGDNDVPADHDAVVVALKSRTAPVARPWPTRSRPARASSPRVPSAST